MDFTTHETLKFTRNNRVLTVALDGVGTDNTALH